jgi:CDI immunity proteins
MAHTNRSLSLEVLEKDYWTQPEEWYSFLEKACHTYRKIPLGQLTIEQLRLLIGQKIGLHYLLPIAFEKLKANILAEGDLYEGDLLDNILKLDNAYWTSQPHYYERFLSILKKKKSYIEKYNRDNKHRQLLKQIDCVLIG